MHYIIVSPILGDVMVRSIIEIFFNNLFISIPSSLIIIKLNLVNNVSSDLALIEFSQIEFHFELCALKSLINIVLFIIILFPLISFIVRLFLI